MLLWTKRSRAVIMLSSTCAACGVSSGRTGQHKKDCGRCKTTYCSVACQTQHWKEGGHKDVCKRMEAGRRCARVYITPTRSTPMKIARGGGRGLAPQEAKTAFPKSPVMLYLPR